MSEEIETPPEKLYYDSLSVARRTSQIIHLVPEHDKAALLSFFIKSNEDAQVIVIIKTKREADSLCKYLQAQEISVLSVHSNKGAKESENSIKSFNDKKTSVLIMTDMVLQAQEFKEITHMISYNIPSDVSYYYERLAALVEKGEGVSLVSEEEQHLMDAIQWAMKVEILEVELEGFSFTDEVETKEVVKKDKTKKPRHKKRKTKKETKKKDDE